MNIVIPMAGEGSRFAKEGYEKPKPFIDVAGKPMIQRVLENLNLPDARYYLIAKKNHLEKESEIVADLQNKFPILFIPIEQLTEGTACTVLFARKYINNDCPLVIANSDQIVDISIIDFINDCNYRKLDGSILTFSDPGMSAKWSYAKINDHGRVLEVQEKKPISAHATVGIYLFSRGKYFVDGAIDMIINNDRVNNEFYTCPVYNFMIKENLNIGIYPIPHQNMHGLGTPDDLQKYLNGNG
ncbi:glycosyltransferase family 2 protein [Haliscomenobacter sp.]|uniref:glycosyltransferase family 2 protein n=1 Tax=Haliscomenobacter sp. TaxID=2717303 RepID=UPI003BA9444C